MRGLALIGAAGFDTVIWSCRDVQFLLRVSIVIAEKETEGAIRIRKPTFERAGNTLTRFVRRLHRQLFARYDCPTRDKDHDGQAKDSQRGLASTTPFDL